MKYLWVFLYDDSVMAKRKGRTGDETYFLDKNHSHGFIIIEIEPFSSYKGV